MRFKNLVCIFCAIALMFAMTGCQNPNAEQEKIDNATESIAASETLVPEETVIDFVPADTPTEHVDERQEWLEKYAEYSVDSDHMDVISGPDITFSIELISDDKTMPYFLFTPSTSETIDDSIPLIVWLHGMGAEQVEDDWMIEHQLPWNYDNEDLSLDMFNAYIVAPQLSENWNSDVWGSQLGKKQVDDVVKRVINEYDIDTDRIIITGHSLGGHGALYCAANDVDNVYSAAIAFSSFEGNGIPWTTLGLSEEVRSANLNNINIPVRAYCGMVEYGEIPTHVDYHKNDLINAFGEENVYFFDTDHNDMVPRAFLLDEDGDNKSDLIEWALRQYKK